MHPVDVLPLKVDELRAQPPAAVSHGGPEPKPEGVRTPTPRLANVERLRLIAMFEIVAFHVSAALSVDGEGGRLPVVAGLGLPTFLLLNNAFNCTLAERMGPRAFMRVKVSRLVLPWLVWSGVYAASLVLERLRHGEPLTEGWSPWMIVGGTYDHLWFVPFALFGGVLIAWLQASTRNGSPAKVVLGALGAGLALAVGCALILATEAIEWPALQWLFALPSPLLGFGIGRAVLAKDERLLQRVALIVTPLAVAVALVTLVEPQLEMLRRYLLSLAVVSAAFIWPGKSDRFSQRLTPLLFGVYLLHPLLVRIYQAIHPPELPLVLLTTVVFAAAAAGVLLIGRTRFRRLV